MLRPQATPGRAGAKGARRMRLTPPAPLLRRCIRLGSPCRARFLPAYPRLSEPGTPFSGVVSPVRLSPGEGGAGKVVTEGATRAGEEERVSWRGDLEEETSPVRCVRLPRGLEEGCTYLAGRAASGRARSWSCRRAYRGSGAVRDVPFPPLDCEGILFALEWL